MKSISVFCGSSEGNDQQIIKMSHELGKTLALKGYTLVYGGSKLGLMGNIANAALENQGKVIGIIPGFLKRKEVVHTGITELHTTQNMHDRKLMLNEMADGIITFPGGFGTMEEFFELLTWAQLGLHKKPIGLLNVNGFFDDLIRLFEKMTVRGLLKEENLSLLIVEDDIELLLNKMEDYKPAITGKWITKEQT
ncbi:TIGR00730 family Rossman fold protein [Robertkochia solimangrovi]|uniref:LOG family protein n=1 Tax=Robertkochia solimangrovi TaxID=2213046 RepID=UPI00117F7F1C|nr:TIGR00730 family Rossman fold protein [Robertkochia solimangrovi]TRZ41067.1 TIGR00730 family Rossman fold protein [Robertkochia solimangrovi]